MINEVGRYALLHLLYVKIMKFANDTLSAGLCLSCEEKPLARGQQPKISSLHCYIVIHYIFITSEVITMSGVIFKCISNKDIKTYIFPLDIVLYIL